MCRVGFRAASAVRGVRDSVGLLVHGRTTRKVVASSIAGSKGGCKMSPEIQAENGNPRRLACLDEPSSSPRRCEWRFAVISRFMYEGGIGAEIGVFKGAFVSYLLSTRPSKLYLVDPWYRLSATWPWAQGDKSTVRALVRILDEYRPEIEAKLIEPRVEFSDEFLSSMPDGYFDWLYIDSSHQYEQTLRELELGIRKIKPGGFIMGDDYNSDVNARHHGVYKAVKEFEAAGRLRLVVAGENMQFVATLP